MQENQDILRRITARKPEYDHMKWEQDWVENLRYMDAISAYPKDWWKVIIWNIDILSQKKKNIKIY